MSDLLSITGSVTTQPQSGIDSLDPAVVASIQESITLSKKLVTDYELNTDPVQAVSLGQLDGVNALVIKTSGGRVRVRLTSTDGSLQVFSVDPSLILISRSVAFTAIDLQRDPATATIAKVFLGQKA